MIERRKPFVLDEQKFSTQRIVTYAIIAIFSAVTAWVLWCGTVEQRSIIIQCVIGLMIGAIAFWMGSSKGAVDNRDQLNRMLTPTGASKDPAAMTANTEYTAATAQLKEM